MANATGGKTSWVTTHDKTRYFRTYLTATTSTSATSATITAKLYFYPYSLGSLDTLAMGTNYWKGTLSWSGGASGSGSTKFVSSSTTWDCKENHLILTKAITVAKGTSAKTVKITGKTMRLHGYSSGSYPTSTATLSVSVPALASYTVGYNANGGSGSVSSQVKWYGIALALRSNSYTRTGYTFSKWNTASGGGGTSYAAGGSYTANSAATLYAQWTANRYTVSYNANGGSGAPASQTATYGSTFTVSGTTPSRAGYAFQGWATSSTGSAVYAAGQSVTWTRTSALTLYAVWAKLPTVKVSAQRASLSGDDATDAGTAGDSSATGSYTLDDMGTYAVVDVAWTCGDSALTALTLACSDSAVTAQVSPDTPTGTSGTARWAFGGLSADSAYTFVAAATSTYGTATASPRCSARASLAMTIPR